MGCEGQGPNTDIWWEGRGCSWSFASPWNQIFTFWLPMLNQGWWHKSSVLRSWACVILCPAPPSPPYWIVSLFTLSRQPIFHRDPLLNVSKCGGNAWHSPSSSIAIKWFNPMIHSTRSSFSKRWKISFYKFFLTQRAFNNRLQISFWFSAADWNTLSNSI